MASVHFYLTTLWCVLTVVLNVRILYLIYKIWIVPLYRGRCEANLTRLLRGLIRRSITCGFPSCESSSSLRGTAKIETRPSGKGERQRFFFSVGGYACSHSRLYAADTLLLHMRVPARRRDIPVSRNPWHVVIRKAPANLGILPRLGFYLLYTCLS